MRTPCSEMYLFCWILTYLILDTQGTMIWRYFTKVTVSSPTPPIVTLLETKPNVRNPFLCGTHCLQYKCQCISFGYVTSSKTCNMYSEKFEGNHGEMIGYTKMTECAMTTPSVKNGVIVAKSACHVSFTCKTGYRLIGESTIQCKDNEEWNVFPICELNSCPILEKKTIYMIYTWWKTTGRTYGDITFYIRDLGYGYECYIRRCQTDGSWSGLEFFSNLHCEQ